MKRDSGIALGFVVGLAALSPAVQGQVVKCTDAEGKVTYTDVPCLRSEASAVVDTRSSVLDNSSLRREAGRLPNSAAPAPQGSSPSTRSEPPAPAPAARTERRSSAYSR
jgi:hypothetical protein